MNELESDKNYRLALEKVNKYHEDPIGLSDYDGTSRSDKINIRQMNLIITLLIGLHQRMDKIDKQIEKIKDEISFSEIKRIKTTTDIEHITEQIGNLSLGKEVKRSPKPKKTLFAVKENE